MFRAHFNFAQDPQILQYSPGFGNAAHSGGQKKNSSYPLKILNNRPNPKFWGRPWYGVYSLHSGQLCFESNNLKFDQVYTKSANTFSMYQTISIIRFIVKYVSIVYLLDVINVVKIGQT